MTPRTLLVRSIAALCPLLLLAPAASAQNLYWDADGNASTNNVDGTGLGNAVTNLWNTSATTWWLNGAGANQAWGNTGAEIANFIGTAGAVSLETNINAGGLVFGVPGYSLEAAAAQTLTIGASGIVVNATGGATTVGSANLSLSLGAAQSWLNNSPGTLTIAGAVSNGANLLTVGGSGNTTVSGVIGTGSGGLAKIGSGTLTLSALSNTFTGAVNANEGTLGFGNVAGLGTAASMTLGTSSTVATLNYTGATATLAKTISLAVPTGNATGQTISAGSGTTLTLSGIISGGPGAGAANTALTFTGGGAFALTANNTFTGNVVVSGTGTRLIVSTTALNGADNSSQLGAAGAHSYTFSGGAIYNQTGNTVNPTAGSNKSFIVGAGGGTFEIAASAFLQLDDANQFSGTGDLTKTGGGTLILGQATVAHTGYTGTTANVNAGILQLGNGQALGSVGTINIGDTSGSTAARLNLTNGTVGNITALVVRGGSSGVKTIAGTNITGTAAFNGALTLNDNVTLEAATGGTLNLAGGISESGVRVVTKTGAGVVLLSSANSYSGGTVINGGTLQFGTSAGTVPATGNITPNAGAAIAATGPAGFSSANEWLASGRIPTSATGAIAIVADDNSNINFAGYDSLYLGSAGAFNYIGTITPGTAGYRLGGGSGALTLPGTNTLTGANPLTIGTSTGNVGVVVLSGANDFTGVTTINAGGILNIRNAGALGSTANGTTISPGGVVQLQGGVTVTGEPLTINAVASTDAQPNGLVNVSGDNEWVGPISGVLTAANNVRASSLAGNLTISGNVSITGTAGQTFVLTGVGNGVVSGNISSVSTTAITKTGTGTWTLSGTNTFTGVTQIQTGAISVPAINPTGTNGPLGAGSVIQLGNPAGTNGGTFIYTGGGETTNRTLSLVGTTGTATLQADNASGLLKFTANLTAPGTVAVDVRKTLTLTGTGVGELSGIIPNSTAGTAGQLATSVAKTGAGSWTLSGANSYTGTTTVSAGTLNLNGSLNNATGSAVNVTGGVLNLNAASAVTKSGITVSGGTLNQSIANAISSTATLAISSGLANLTFDNDYTGVTTVSGGVLKLASVNALPGGIDVAGGTSGLTFSGTGGVIGLAAGDFTRGLGTGATQVQWTGSGGFAAFGAGRAVNLGGASAPMVWGTTASFVPTGSALILGASSADGTVTFQNPIDLNGATRTIQVDNGTASIDAILGGLISGSAALSGLTKTGAGTLQLTNAANSFTGQFTIGAGAVNTGDLAVLGGATLGLGTTTTVGTLDYTGADLTLAKNLALAAPTGNATGNTISISSGTTLTLSGIISGGPANGAANQALRLSGGGTFVLTGVNTFTGNLTATGAGTKLVVNPTQLSNADATSPLGGTGQHSYTFSGGGTYNQTGSTVNPTAASNKSFVAGAGGATFDIASGATLQLDDANQFSGTGDLTKAGGGVMILGQASTGYAGYTGANVNVNAGTLRLANSIALGSAGTIHLGDATGAIAPTLHLLNAGTVIPATTAFVVRAGSTGAKTLLNSVAGTANGLDGPVTLNDALTVDSTGTLTLNGAIAGTAGINKVGTGTLVLSGANTFGGGLTITAGTTRFAKEVSFANGNTANWTPTNLVVNSGTTAAFNVGGTGEFTSDDIQIIKGLGTATGGFKSGANLGLDTSNAAGGSFSYAGAAIANPNGGANTLNVIKAGAGTLELTQANSYTGNTAVNQGTLRLSAANAVAGPLNFGGVAANAPTATAGAVEFGANNPTLGVINVYTNTATANTMTIAAGQILTSSGNVIVGTTTAAGAVTTALTVAGDGAWNISGTGLTLRVGGTNVGASTNTLDLSALASFSANLGTGGFFRLGSNETTVNPSDTNLISLAPSSTITVGTIDIGGSAAHAGSNTLRLGTGSNTLNADSINVGSRTAATTALRSNGKIDFTSASSGSLTIRATDGTGAAALHLLNSSAETNTVLVSEVLLAGHSADVLLSSLVVLSRNPGGTAWNTATNTATFTFDQGTFQASTVTLSNRAGSSVTTANTVATLSLGGTTAVTTATLGAVTMATNTASNAASSGSANATLNVSGIGTTSIASIAMGNTSASGTGATSSSNGILNISGSTTTIGSGGTAITMAVNNSAATAGVTNSNATINISGGSTTVAGGISMANAVQAGSVSTGTINLTAGSLTVNGNIVRAAGAGTENTSLVLNGGTLDLAGSNLGDSVKPIGSGSGALSFQSGTLENVGEINGGVSPLTKSGAGTLILAGDNGYTGGTNVNAGSLLVNGSISGNVTVAANAILGGTGTITPGMLQTVNVVSGGIIAPGASIGTLSLDGSLTPDPVLTLASGALFSFELNVGLASDRIKLDGAGLGDIAFNNNTINFTDLSTGTLAGGSYTLFSADAAGAYNGLTIGGGGIITDGLEIGSGLGAYPDAQLQVVGNNIVLTGVPEPTSAMILLAGLGSLVAVRRTRRS